MIVCPKCKTRNLLAARFCEKCGTELEDNIIAASAAVSEQEAENRAESAEAPSQTESAAAEQTPEDQKSEEIIVQAQDGEAAPSVPAPPSMPVSAKKQRASLFTEPNSILDRIQNRSKSEKAPLPASVPGGLQNLPAIANNKSSKSAGEILNIAIAAVTGIGVLWLCFYVLKRKFSGKE
ncbi:TFIIB-type zinc ribbon-containing protein [bacterium]|nr:TFIIB-type zinc ribbon-containing protein [bacterium]